MPTFRNVCRNCAAMSGGMMLMLALGCGSDASADPSVVDTGLPSSQPLSTLTIAQSSQLCEATTRAVGDLFGPSQQLTAACTLQATLSAIDTGADGRPQLVQRSCERERDACIADFGTPPMVAPTDNCQDAVRTQTFTGPCTATVEEFERCATASVRAARAALAKLSCAYLATQPVILAQDPTVFTAAPADATAATEPTPPECVDFEAKCGVIDLAGF